MEDKQVMSIIEDADCDVEACFINSHKGYSPCGWAKTLVETAYKAGQEESDKKWRQILKDSVDMAKIAGQEAERDRIIKYIEEHFNLGYPNDKALKALKEGK